MFSSCWHSVRSRRSDGRPSTRRVECPRHPLRQFRCGAIKGDCGRQRAGNANGAPLRSLPGTQLPNWQNSNVSLRLGAGDVKPRNGCPSAHGCLSVHPRRQRLDDLRVSASNAAQEFVRGAGVRTWRRTSVLRTPLPPRPCGGFPAAGFHSRPVSREFVRIRLKEQKWQELKGCHIVRRPRGLRSLWNCQVNATPAIRHRQPPPGGSPGTAIPGFVFDFTRAAMAGRPRATRGYCLSYTTTLLTVWPLAFLPVCVKVRVFPSFETTALAVAFCFPPNCVVISRVYASIRL